MTVNVVPATVDIFWVVSGAIVLFLFALTIAMPHRANVLPGSSGHRDKTPEEDKRHEVIRADGYIDDFAGVIEEAGGSMPPIVKLAIPGILLWWLAYMILFWTPR